MAGGEEEELPPDFALLKGFVEEKDIPLAAWVYRCQPRRVCAPPPPFSREGEEGGGGGEQRRL